MWRRFPGDGLQSGVAKARKIVQQLIAGDMLVIKYMALCVELIGMIERTEIQVDLVVLRGPVVQRGPAGRAESAKNVW